MSKCGKGCMPECEYFTTGGCISPFNCMYKEESGYINSATSGSIVYTGRMNKPKILISIHSQWCEKIFNREKRIEVRKTAPNFDTPFEALVYCTKSKPFLYKNPNNGELFLDSNGGYRGGDYEDRYLTGKVIGSFMCDKILPIDYIRYWNNGIAIDTCLSYGQIANYGKGKPLYGWHISDLKIYDKPKKLSDFRGLCKKNHECENPVICEYLEYDALSDCGFNCSCARPYITRAPQSWCYVEEV